MIVPSFEIPLRLGDLEEPGTAGLLGLRDELTVSDVISRLNDAQKDSEEGAEFIVDYFSTFYYLCKQFKDFSNHVKEKGYKILFKSFKKTTLFLEGKLQDSLETEEQQNLCNVVKMLGYMFIEVAKRLQDYHCELANLEAKTKGKKNARAEGFMDWVEEKTQLMNIVYSFLQLPLKLLWDPPAVDEEFINIFANFCYKCLEDISVTGVTMKPFRSSIFQVLSTLIRKHLHGLSFCVKVVQLLRLNEHLVNPLAQGVIEVVNDGCNNVVREIVREMGEADEQLLSDASGARCLSQFLSLVAEAAPKAACPAVELLMAFLGRDPPALRCCALTVLGEVVQALLTKEDLEQELRDQRDAHLDTLEEHIHDTNAFVRSRALQVWQKLSLAKAIPVARLHNLLELVIGRLGDKSSNVKKQAVQLIKALLEGNPYSSQLDVKDITNELDNKREKLNHLLQTHKLHNSPSEWPKMVVELKEALSNECESSMAVEGQTIETALKAIQSSMKQRNFSAAVAVFNQLKDDFYKHLEVDGDDDTETSLQVLKKIWEQTLEIPEISQDILERKETLERSIAYLEGALEFAKQIDRALPLILTLLDSSAQTDVLEAISFFTSAFQFGFSKSGEGVRIMLDLVFSKEASIKTAVCNAYQELYFVGSATDRKRSVDAVKNLSELVVQLDVSQMDALEEMMREWVRSGIVDKHCIQVMFERFSLKISGTTEAQSWAALALIAMVGAEQPKVIRSNVSVLISEGLGPRGASNPILAQYTCRALQKLAPDGHKLPPDDEILIRLWRQLREGLWSSPTNTYFVPFADEAMMLIFQLAERPDKFAEELIVDLYTGIKTGKKPVTKQSLGRVLMNNKDDDLFGLEENQKESEEESFEEMTQSAEADMSPEAVLLRLTRFVSLLGAVAAHYVGFLENRILGELKRRNLAEFERKMKRKESKRGDSSIVDREELEFKKTATDDMNSDQVRMLAEEDIVAGEGLLAKFLPFLQSINRQPGKFPYLPLQNAALLALGMFMQVSSKVCDQNLQLLVTVTEKSQSPDKRINGLLLLWALQFRFPNVLEPWTSHMFALLKDDEPSVRRTAVHVVTHLIVNEMVKVRTNLPDLAIRIVDADTVIAQTTRHFFREYSLKGNALFNDLPVLVYNLTNPNLNLEEEKFRTIMRFILNLVTKDKQLELLVEKLCINFESASTDRQCHDLAFCLTQLQYSEKALRKILENFSHFGNKLYLAEVYEAFTTILATAAKNPQKDKSLLDELQALVKEYREKSCIDRNISVTIPIKRCPPSTTRKRIPKRRQVSSCSEQEDEREEKPVPKSTRKRQPRHKITSNSDSDGDNFIQKKQAKKKLILSDDSDSGESVRKLAALKITSSKKARSKARSVSVKTDTDDSAERKPVRSTRKRN